jgi:hypothetical protein
MLKRGTAFFVVYSILLALLFFLTFTSCESFNPDNYSLLLEVYSSEKDSSQNRQYLALLLNPKYTEVTPDSFYIKFFILDDSWDTLYSISSHPDANNKPLPPSVE